MDLLCYGLSPFFNNIIGRALVRWFRYQGYAQGTQWKLLRITTVLALLYHRQYVSALICFIFGAAFPCIQYGIFLPEDLASFRHDE